MTIVCKHCGLPQEDHHEFDPQMPDGCVCDPFAWFGTIDPVCGNYIGEDGECAVCAHEKGCHNVHLL